MYILEVLRADLYPKVSWSLDQDESTQGGDSGGKIPYLCGYRYARMHAIVQ